MFKSRFGLSLVEILSWVCFATPLSPFIWASWKIYPDETEDFWVELLVRSHNYHPATHEGVVCQAATATPMSATSQSKLRST